MADFEEFNKTHKAETFKSVLTIGMEVLKALILINGGAAAGMVATLDKLRPVVSATALQGAMVCFVLGLIAAVLSGCGGYFTQYSMHESNMGRQPAVPYHRFRKATIALTFLSLGLFACGALTAAFGLK